MNIDIQSLYICMYVYGRKQSNLYILWFFNKNDNNWALQCVSWINPNL